MGRSGTSAAVDDVVRAGTDGDVTRAGTDGDVARAGTDGDVARAATDVPSQEVPDSVLGKVDRLLSTLAALDEPPGLSELARASGLPKATVHRLVTELAGLGLVEKTATGIGLGPRLFELGQQVPRYRDLAHVAVPFIEDLYLATHGATVHFGVRDGFEMIYLVKVRGHGGVEEPSRVAGRIPVHCTATGRAFLSALPDEEVDAVIAHGLSRMTPYTTTLPSVLRKVIDDARVQGVATEHEEVLIGYGAVAAPVLDEHGPVASIGVVTPLSTGSPASFAGAVRTAALGLSRELRRSPGTGRSRP